MKNTKTTIRELSARYRDILKKCFFLNAVAIGLFAATSASAAIDVVTNVTGSGMAIINKTMTNIESAVQSAARTAVQADLNNSDTGIYTAVLTPVKASLNEEPQSSIYTLASGGAYYGDGSATTVDMTSVTSVVKGDYQFEYNGTRTALADSYDDGHSALTKTLYSANTDKLSSKTSTDLSGYTSYADGKVTRSALTYGALTLGADTTADAANKTAALTSGDFKFTSTYAGAGDVVIGDVNVGNTTYVTYETGTDGKISSASLNKAAYTFDTAATDTTKIKRTADNNLSVDGISAADYKYRGTDSSEGEVWYTMTLDSNGDLIIPSAALHDSTAIDNASLALAAYNADRATFDTKTADYNTDAGKLATAVTAYNTDVTGLNTLAAAYDTDYLTAFGETKDKYDASNTSYQAALGAYNTDNTNLPTAVANYGKYEDSLAVIVDNRAQEQIGVALEEGGAIRTAVTAGITDLITTKEGLLSQDIGYNLADPDNADTGLVARLEALTDESQDKTLVGAINANTDAIAALKTEAETVFAEKQQWVDNTLGIVSKNPDAVKTEYASTNYLKDAETLTGADKALDAELAKKANLTDVYTRTEAEAIFAEKQQWVDNTLGITSANPDAVKTEYASTNYLKDAETLTGADIALDAAIQDNANAIEKLNGTVDTEGSVLYMIDGVVGHANTAAGKKPGDDGYTGSGLFAALDAEAVTRAEAITTVTNSLNAEVELRDAQIGDLASVATSGSSYLKPAAGGSATNPPSVSEQLTTIGTTLEDVLGSADALKDVFAAAGESAPTNLAGYLTQQAAGAAQTQASNEARFAKLDSKINKLENKMEKGLAANNALAGLVPLDHVHKTQISAALGGYKSNQALAVGAFHYLNNRTLLNAGAAYGGNDSVSYKVGVTFGF